MLSEDKELNVTGALCDDIEDLRVPAIAGVDEGAIRDHHLGSLPGELFCYGKFHQKGDLFPGTVGDGWIHLNRSIFN